MTDQIAQLVKELHLKHSGINDRPEMWQDIAKAMEKLGDPAADKPYDCYWSRRALAAEKLLTNLLATCPHDMEGPPRAIAAWEARAHLENFSANKSCKV